MVAACSVMDPGCGPTAVTAKVAIFVDAPGGGSFPSADAGARRTAMCRAA
jgi:hypothetical protein